MSQMIEMSKIKVKDRELHRLLGYPSNHEISEAAKELITWATEWSDEYGKPWMTKLEVGVEFDQQGHMRLDGVGVSSEEIIRRFSLAGVEKGFVIAASGGIEADQEVKRLWKEGYVDQYYFLEMYSAAVVEELILSAAADVCAEADGSDYSVLPRYSPGYSGWDLSCQKDLYKILDKHDPEFKNQIGILQSGMLFPKKSQFSFIGLTKQHLHSPKNSLRSPCRSCSFSPCQYRREPYVASEQANSSFGEKLPSLDSISYGFSETVLKKWCQKRLNLKRKEDGTIQAVFEATGSTCENLGWPLSFLFTINLRVADLEYVIDSAIISNNDQEEGYMKMCQYAEQNDGFLESLTPPKDFRGKSLVQLIQEYRSNPPAGCLCNSEGRKYFWNIALQTTHYYLYNENIKDKNYSTVEK